jgi:hypothetical protein
MPHEVTVSKLKKQFCETGSVADRKRSVHSYSGTDHDQMVNVLARVVVNPHRSMRKTGQETGLSHICCTHFKVKQVPSFQVTYIQELCGDRDRHEESVQSSTYSITLFSDEVLLHLNEMVSHHYCHYWMSENIYWS